MSGRFTLIEPVRAAAELFGAAWPEPPSPRYNIGPTQPVWAVREGGLFEARWNFVARRADGPTKVNL